MLENQSHKIIINEKKIPQPFFNLLNIILPGICEIMKLYVFALNGPKKTDILYNLIFFRIWNRQNSKVTNMAFAALYYSHNYYVSEKMTFYRCN